MTKTQDKFEKFYLIDKRGNKGRVISKFVHIKNDMEIDANTAITLRILQRGEIQVMTKFATKEFIYKYAKKEFPNIKNMKIGDPINIYWIPVIKVNNKYYAKFVENN